MRVRLSSFVLATLTVVSSASFAAEQPPRNLHQVNGHWTAWEPPTPPEGAQVHVIQSGDTLWGLAAQYYKDPYLWPQLWERNQYILDAHWIYPGDPLVHGLEVAPVDTLAEEDDSAPFQEGTETPVDGDVLTSEQAAGSPIPLGGESDIYCSGYIGNLDEKFEYTIISSEYESLGPDLDLGPSSSFTGSYGRVGTVKYVLSTGDIIYLDGGRARGMQPGDLYTVVDPQKQVLHPLTNQVVGRFYHYAGRVRVLSVQEDTAIAEIVHSCDPIVIGSLLQPFEPEPVPLGRPSILRPINFPESEEQLRDAPVILFSQDNLVSLGEDHVVYIDRGANQDVTPGDVYTIYRKNRAGLPPIVMGELAVLSVHENSSVARIIESRYAIYVGDRLSPK